MLFCLKNGIINLYIRSKGVVCIKEFQVQGDYITLTQFLKELTYISSGGQAKYFLDDVLVLVNDQPENRRGKKLRAGDKVQIEDDQYHLVQAIS